MNYLITGTSGYVGSQLMRYLKERGHSVTELRRSPSNAPQAKVVPFTLGETPSVAQLQGADALIHCAYDFTARGWHDIAARNVEGTEKLFRAAKDAGVASIVLISSISAFEGCRSLYGRAKLACEAIAAAHGGVIIRPGLVYGASPGGMVGKLRQSVRGPLVPVIGGSQQMYLTHEDDLAALVEIASQRGRLAPGIPMVAAHETPVQFRDILRALAKAEGSSPLLLPVPWQCVWLGLATAELLGVKLSMRSDSVVSLMNPDPRPPFVETRRAGVTFRSFLEERVEQCAA